VTVVASIATALLTSVLVLQYAGLDAGPQQDGAPQMSEEVERVGGTDSYEDTIIAVADRVSDSVVSVVATQDLPVIEQFYIDPFGGGSPFRVPQFRQRGTEEQQVAAGTGFIVSEDGYVITNRHVVGIEDADFTVIFASGERIAAEVIAVDSVEDLAVLKIDRMGLTPILFGNSDALAIGQTVIAIGNALGEFQNTVSVGVISGLARRLVAGDSSGVQEVIEDAIQTDAAINPGNSGGPLVNLRGEVIGINTAIAIGSENLGFAIPANKAKKVLEDVRTTGRISRPFLGVQFTQVDQGIQEARSLPHDYGALVIGSAGEPGVLAGSPAAAAGIQEGDVILEVNGERVTVEQQLSSLVQRNRVGETVTLKVWSNGEEKEVPATLVERP